MSLPSTDLLPIIGRMAGRRVLVVGDLTLDEYVYGRATRLSREAPIPVLEWQRTELILGGAANPARNIVALGGRAAQVGVCGADEEGERIGELLRAAGIDPAGLYVSGGRPTTRKTRVLAEDAPRLPQQLARIDRLRREPLDPAEEQGVIAALERLAPAAEALLCSDYQIGLLTPAVVDAARELCQRHGLIFSVDAQGSSHLYRGADLFRCNNHEAEAALGYPLRDTADYERGLAELRGLLGARLVIVTRGPDGLALSSAETGYRQLAAHKVSEVYDTTGAGDTFIAVATLALLAGAGPVEAAAVANTAAALVVRRLGNAVVSPAELAAALEGA